MEDQLTVNSLLTWNKQMSWECGWKSCTVRANEVPSSKLGSKTFQPETFRGIPIFL